MRKSFRNDKERADWINNEPGLYHWWQCSGVSITVFIRTFRSEIDVAIDKALGVKHEQRN